MKRLSLSLAWSMLVACGTTPSTQPDGGDAGDAGTDAANDAAADATPSCGACPVPAEWVQDGHDAQRTGASPEEPGEPWTLKWTWNGPDASGGTGGHAYDAPKEARTIVGGGNVYVPAGAQGLYALAQTSGQIVWHLATPAFDAAPAYDPASGRLFAGGSDGRLYAIDGASGDVLASYDAGGAIEKAVLSVPPFVYVVTTKGDLHKVDATSLGKAWVYSGGSPAATPASYSASRDVVVFATADLVVHAIKSTDGTASWSKKPTPNTPGFPYGFDDGWPVIAEKHGVVFVRMTLSQGDLGAYPSTNNVYPNTNAEVRTWLEANPQRQNLFALSLDDGSPKFTPAVGYGSTEDYVNGGPYGVMGSQPVIKTWPNGDEVAYIHFRNGQGNPPDYRWDGHMGEMVLDDTTVPTLKAGDLRFVRMSRLNAQGSAYVYLVDEQEPITIAGSTLFHAHWGASESVKIGDRSPALGLAYATPIASTDHPAVIRRQTSCGDFNPTTHATTCGLTLYQDGRYWDGPGFWTYWNVLDPPASPAPSSYSTGFRPRYTYASDGLVVVEGNGGDLMVFKHE